MAVNGPMRTTAPLTSSPFGCTTLVDISRPGAAVISRWISIHKRSSSAAFGVMRDAENSRRKSSRHCSPAFGGYCVEISDCCSTVAVSFAT